VLLQLLLLLLVLVLAGLLLPYVAVLKAQQQWALAMMLVVLVMLALVLLAVMLVPLMKWEIALVMRLVRWKALLQALEQVMLQPQSYLPGKMCRAPETLLH
jgi:hypothetical protein